MSTPLASQMDKAVLDVNKTLRARFGNRRNGYFQIPCTSGFHQLKLDWYHYTHPGVLRFKINLHSSSAKSREITVYMTEATAVTNWLCTGDTQQLPCPLKWKNVTPTRAIAGLPAPATKLQIVLNYEEI